MNLIAVEASTDLCSVASFKDGILQNVIDLPTFLGNAHRPEECTSSIYRIFCAKCVSLIDV